MFISSILSSEFLEEELRPFYQLWVEDCDKEFLFDKIENMLWDFHCTTNSAWEKVSENTFQITINKFGYFKIEMRYDLK